MQENQKKLYIKTIVIVVIFIVIFLILFIQNKNKKQEQLQIVQLTTQLLDTENIKELGYGVEKTEEEISSKYTSTKDKYEIKAKIIEGEGTKRTEGKMIYVRSNYSNLNIYKTEYKLNKYKDNAMQIREIIEEFEIKSEKYMNFLEKYEKTDYLYGESTLDYERPIEESIYVEGRLYSKTLKNEEKEYNINYYKSGNSIICELVRVL